MVSYDGVGEFNGIEGTENDVRMNQEAALSVIEPTETVISLVTNTVDSSETKRAYRRALEDFLSWHAETGHPALARATVQRYAAELRAQGMGAASINQRLSAIRKLAAEAADNGLLDPSLATGVQNVRGARQEGRRTGNWLTKDQAQALLNAPDVSSLKGLRDRAIVAVLLGCGLRRREAAELTFDHVQQREGRWAIVDLVGKRNKVRTVPMPSWAKAAIDTWAQAAAIGEGRIFRAMNKGDRVVSDTMSPQAIRNVVKAYVGDLGLDHVAPHDLRRTFAKLAHKGEAGLDQIQLSLGHASIETTEQYLGVEQDLTDAPCDRLGLRLER